MKHKVFCEDCVFMVQVLHPGVFCVTPTHFSVECMKKLPAPDYYSNKQTRNPIPEFDNEKNNCKYFKQKKGAG